MGLSGEDKAGFDGAVCETMSECFELLIAEKYTDPKRVAASGTSRGGFCAFHFAAAEPRVRAVAGVSPVTNLLTLREFTGVSSSQVETLNVPHLVKRLAGRSVWLSIGNHDLRVGTDDCIGVARQLVAEGRRHQPSQKVMPVELVVGPSDGHHAIEGAYVLAAKFLQKQFQD